MTLRTRLIALVFLVAVVPMAGTTVYSYVASRRAYEQAVAAEAAALAAEMPGRMASVTADLGRRIALLEDVPFGKLKAKASAGADATREGVFRRLDRELGPAADLVASFEFTPLRPPAAPRPGAPPAPPEGLGGDKAEKSERLLLAMQSAAGVAADQDVRHEWRFRHVADPREAEAFRREMEAAAEALRRQALVAAREGDAVAAQVREAQRAAEGRTRRMAGVPAEKSALEPGREFACTPKSKGAPIGRLKAHVPTRRILSRVLGGTRRRQHEVAFAIDAQGALHVGDADRGRRDEVAAVVKAVAGGSQNARLAMNDWVLATHRDPVSSMTWGVARPVGGALREIRATAVRNLLLGLGVAAVALIAVIPLSRRLTRDLAALTAGAERLGRGDFAARVPVRSRDEVGRLAETFNRMGEELRAGQERLVEQERLRRELELCRRIQEEMLPHAPLRFLFAEAQGISIPAREVGGDFFNYFVLPTGEAALLVGDVSGKGVPAALLMANVQATLRARLPLTNDLAQLAAELDLEIEAATSRPTYLTLFVGILDGERKLLRYVNAGQNPPILVRASGESVRLDSTGRPLALLSGGPYEQRSVAIGDGDAILLYTDGLVESEDARGEPYGLARLERVLAGAREASLDAILTRIDESVRAHRSGTEPADDATVLVLRVGPALGA